MSAARARRIRFGASIGFAMLLAMPLPVAAAGPVATANSSLDRAPAGSAGGSGAAGAAATSNWIVTLKPGGDAPRTAAPMAKAVGGKAGLVFRHALHGFVFRGTADAAAALRRNPNIRTVVADRAVHVLADTITPGIARIRASHPTEPNAFDSGFTGRGVRVAILDTGVDLTHPDLLPNLDLAMGRNCMTAGPPQDGHGHGTHVAGIVAAAANGIGVVGVAPDAKIVPIKVLNDAGSGEWSNLICAVDYLTGLMTDGDPTNDVRVANMSLGDVGTIGSCTDGGIREAICHSVAAGVVYIAAAGNSTVDASTFIPAAFPEVIAVSALTDLDGESGGLGGCWLFFFFCDDTLAEYSNFGATIDVTAPGTQILSDWTGGGYATEMGTSMASPHVAGVAALMIAATPSLTPADVEAMLKSRGQCPSGAWADGAGDCTGEGQWGNDPDGIAEPLVNALRAVQGGTPGDRRPVVRITAPADGATVAGMVTVTATATDDVGVTKVDFYVDGALAATDTDGTDGYSMNWDSSLIDGAVYNLTATGTDTIGQTGTWSISVRTALGVQGSWVGHYGQDGYILANWDGNNTDLANLPAGVTYALEAGARATWVSPTSDVRALTNPAGTERRSQTFYGADTLRVRLSFAAPYSGTLHLYAVDWDAYGGNRYENITIDDGTTPRVAHLSSSFVPGAWIHAPISVGAGGSVVVTVDRTAGNSAVLAGLFLGGATTPPPPPPSLPFEIPGVHGTWVGNYGHDGYILANWDGTNTDLVSLPAGVSAALEQGLRYTWASPTSDVRALTNPSGTERQSQTWYDTNQIRIRLDFAAPYSGTLHLYAVDWDAYGGNRFEHVTVDDGTGPRTARLTSSFVTGAWVHAPITVGAGGSVVITVDRTGGITAVLAGLFLGGASTPQPPPPTLPVDSPGFQGGWVGHYGHEGYILANWDGNNTDLTSLPAGVTHALELGARATWVSPTSDVRALTNPAGTERRSQTWYGADRMQVRLSFATPFSGTLHLYAVDWDAWGGNRYENITVDDGSGPRVAHLSSSFVPGAWIHAPISVGAGGSVVVTVDRTAGNSAVLAGLFLDEGAAPPPPTAPGAPTGLVATPGNAQVALAWTAPASDGGSEITGYVATASPGGATCATSTLGCTIGGLANGTAYSFTVTAANAVGTGPASAPATATPVAPATVPDAPTGLTATPGNAQVVLSWTAPASDGGSQITGYTATASPGGATCTTVTLGCTIGGLTNGTPYTFTVTAANAVGTGPASAPASATPVAPPPTVPAAPTGLTGTPGNAQVVLAWTPPASDGGSPITGYRIYRGTASGGETLLATVGVMTSYTDTTAKNGTTYYYQVAARNAVGVGPRSVEVSARPATVPGAPRIRALRSATRGVDLTWSAPTSTGGSPITGYRIYRSTSSGTETFLIAVGNVAAYTDTANTPGVRYYYRISAVSAIGEGTKSAEANALAR